MALTYQTGGLHPDSTGMAIMRYCVRAVRVRVIGHARLRCLYLERRFLDLDCDLHWDRHSGNRVVVRGLDRVGRFSHGVFGYFQLNIWVQQADERPCAKFSDAMPTCGRVQMVSGGSVTSSVQLKRVDLVTRLPSSRSRALRRSIRFASTNNDSFVTNTVSFPSVTTTQAAEVLLEFTGCPGSANTYSRLTAGFSPVTAAGRW